jgi:hypothetical protein
MQVDLDYIQNDGYYPTALFTAVAHGQIGIVKFLIDAGANVFQKNFQNELSIDYTSGPAMKKILQEKLDAAKEEEKYEELREMIRSRTLPKELYDEFIQATATDKFEEEYEEIRQFYLDAKEEMKKELRNGEEFLDLCEEIRAEMEEAIRADERKRINARIMTAFN